MSRRILLWVAIISLVIFVYAAVLRQLVRPWVILPDIPGGLNAQTMVLTLFSLTHALYSLGWRKMLAFFGLSAVISWCFEQAGVATGAIYGPYHYTGALGVKLGHVPLLIPLAWFMMIYPSYVIANLIAGDEPTGSRGRVRRIIWLAFLSAVVMTAWDLLVDPVLSGPPLNKWIWETGGPYFGIPIQNYVGWMLTTFTVYVIYRLLERRLGASPVSILSAWIAVLPLIAYGSMMIANMFSSGPEALKVIGPFVMGVPLFIAISRLWNMNPNRATAP